MRCTYCGSQQHSTINCPKTWEGQSNRLAMQCSYCGKTDHNINACLKTWGGNAARAWNPDMIADDFVKDRNK
jgi:DNA-directed RNA polymerase subunit RPC12/RpoP